MPIKKSKNSKIDFSEYFKVGVSVEYILIRDDFPMKAISPSDFSNLIIDMFRRNDEVLHGE